MKNIKYLYVITCNEEVFFLEQLLISVYSLKSRIPDAYVAILSDVQTDEIKHFKTSSLASYIDELVLIELDRSLSCKLRSRYLKTNMRNYVDGDFLFIDCDTVITESFDVERDFTDDLMSVPDCHVPLNEHYIKRCFYEQLKPFGVENGEGYYWNSGVLFVKDNEKTRSFFNRWFENYKYGVSKGITQDQASLYATNRELNLISELPAKYNVQILFGLHFLHEAKIIHYFSSNKKHFMEFASDVFLEKIRKEGLSSEQSELILNPLKAFVPNTGILYGLDLYSFYSIENNEHNIYKIEQFGIGNAISLQFYKRVDAKGITALFRYLNIIILSVEVLLCNFKVRIHKLLN